MAQPDLNSNVNAVLRSSLDPDSKLVLLRSLTDPAGVTIDLLLTLRIGELRVAVAVGKLVRDGLLTRSEDKTSIVFAGVPVTEQNERQWTAQEHFGRWSAVTKELFSVPSHETVRAFSVVLAAIKKNLRDRYLDRFGVAPTFESLDAMIEDYISSSLRWISQQPGMGTNCPTIGLLRMKATLDRWVDMKSDEFRKREVGASARTNAEAGKSLGLT